MAKKLIQNIMQRLHMIPDKEKIGQHKSLQFLGDKLHQPHLWHINRHSVARAFAVGGFAMYTPPLPWQMVIAAVLAIYFEANLPISVALVWITNPLTWIPLYYIAYSVGALLLGGETYSFDDFQSVFTSLGDAWEKLGAPFLVGCFAMMVLCAIAGYFGIQAFWRHQVLKAWEKRKAQRREGVRRVFEGKADEPETTKGENFMTLLTKSLGALWNNTAQPFLNECDKIINLCAKAGREGMLTFWNEATVASEQYKIQKRDAQRQTAPKEQQLLLDSLKLLQVIASAGHAGIRTFWLYAVKALEQRKTERQKQQAANLKAGTEEAP